MSLNDIQLAPDLLLALYGKSLVSDAPHPAANPRPAQPVGVQQTDPPTTETPSSILPFLGDNKKHITLLVYYPQHTYLPDEVFNFLGNILNACQLSAKDTAIVNMAQQPAAYADLLNQLQPRQLICFGTEARPLNWPAVNLLQVSEQSGRQLLEAPTLDALNQNSTPGKALKKQLWEALKKMLGV